MAVVVVTFFVVAGCGGAGPAPHASRTTTTTGSPHRLRVDLVTSGRRDVAGCSLLVAARQAARSAGIDLVVHDVAAVTWTEQAHLVVDAVDAHPNAVVLEPVDYPRLVPVIRAAHDQGVHVVLLDVSPDPNPGLAWSFVASDEPAVEHLAARELTRLLGERSGRILLVAGSGSDSSRVAVFDAGLTAAGRLAAYRLSLRGTDGGASGVAAFLRAHPQVVGAFAMDDLATRALARAKSAVAPRLVVVAAGDEPEEVRLLRAGTVAELVAPSGVGVGTAAVTSAVAAAVSHAIANRLIAPTVLTSERAHHGVYSMCG